MPIFHAGPSTGIQSLAQHNINIKYINQVNNLQKEMKNVISFDEI